MQNLIKISHNQPVTTSLQVAEVFGKRHKNVLQKIDNLINELPENYRRLNFKPSERTTTSGAFEKKERFFEMTKDGFVLLAMGFTGKKAMQFKIAY